MTVEKETEFERVARKLECDEDEKRFNATLKKVASNPSKKGEKHQDGK